MVLGRDDYQHRLFPFVRPMVDEREAIVLQEDRAHWLSTYLYVENAGEAIAAACADERAAGKVYNVADGALSWLELGGLVARELSWDGEFVLYPKKDLPKPLVTPLRWEQAIIGTAVRIQDEIGYQPVVDFVEGVRCAVAWERDHPPDPAPVESLNYEAEDDLLGG
jgi:nucleoside-diphosphate-sugar epimerase